MRRGLVCTAICWICITTAMGCQYARNYGAADDGAEQIPLATAPSDAGRNSDEIRQAEAIEDAEATDAGAVTQVADSPSAWSRFLSRFTLPKSVPLPLTDSDEDSEASASDSDDPGDF
jgi:hypothetical protein